MFAPEIVAYFVIAFGAGTAGAVFIGRGYPTWAFFTGGALGILAVRMVTNRLRVWQLARLCRRSDEPAPASPMPIAPVELRAPDRARDGYCLHCHAPSESGQDERLCERCGRTSLPAIRDMHWSLHPAMRALEAAWMLIILAFPFLVALFDGAEDYALTFFVYGIGIAQLSREFRRRRPAWIYVAFAFLLAIPAMSIAAELAPDGASLDLSAHLAWLGLAALTIYACIDPGGILRGALVRWTQPPGDGRTVR